MLNLILLSLLTVLQFADAYTTHIILSRGGRENNPLMRSLFERLGILPAMAVMKGLVILAAGVAVVLAPVPAQWAIAAVCIFYCWLVWKNWREL
jgi:hypothetical protein